MQIEYIVLILVQTENVPASVVLSDEHPLNMPLAFVIRSTVMFGGSSKVVHPLNISLVKVGDPEKSTFSSLVQLLNICVHGPFAFTIFAFSRSVH